MKSIASAVLFLWFFNDLGQLTAIWQLHRWRVEILQWFTETLAIYWLRFENKTKKRLIIILFKLQDLAQYLARLVTHDVHHAQTPVILTIILVKFTRFKKNFFNVAKTWLLILTLSWWSWLIRSKIQNMTTKIFPITCKIWIERVKIQDIDC